MGETQTGYNAIIEILKANPNGMSLKEISKGLNINRITAARYLDVLRVSGKIEMVPFGQAKVFFLSRKVPLSSLTDLMSDILLIIDNRRKIIQINSGFLNLFGGSSGDYIGNSVYDTLCFSCADDFFFNSIDLAFRGKEIGEEIVIETDNRELNFEVRIYPSALENGESSVTILMSDITGERTAENLIKLNRDMMLKITASVNPSDISDAGIGMAFLGLKCDAAAVFLKNSDNLFSPCLYEGDDGIFDKGHDSVWNKGIIYNKVMEGVPSYFSLNDGHHQIPGIILRLGYNSLSLNPLSINGEVSGFFTTMYSRKGDFSENSRNLLELISAQMSLALKVSDPKGECFVCGEKKIVSRSEVRDIL